jgi:hypothetical protein
MTFRYALIREAGEPFAVVLVQKSILDDSSKAEQAIDWLQKRHFHMPTALMARDAHGIPNSYFGRGDLALRLSRFSAAALPWQEFNIS